MNLFINRIFRPKAVSIGGFFKAGLLMLAGIILVGGFVFTKVYAETAVADMPKTCDISKNASTASPVTPKNTLQRFRAIKTEMAIPVNIVLYAKGPDVANTAAEAVFARFAQLNAVLSDYDKNSELRRLCATAGSGQAISVSNDLWVVLSAAVGIAHRSNGAFDPTIAPVVRLWRRARRRGEMPDTEKLAQARKLVDYRFVRIDDEHKTVELVKPDMRIDLGGIAKGYALDEALKVLASHGITRALVDAGGDIALGDSPPGKKGWSIGVARLDPQAPPRQYLCLSRVAVATSGDTHQYVKIGSRRYSHIVDPRTGIGLTDHSSVTVIAPTAIVADGLASALSVLGPRAGIKLIETVPDAAAFIVRAQQGKIETYRSCRWKNYPSQTDKTLTAPSLP